MIITTDRVGPLFRFAPPFIHLLFGERSVNVHRGRTAREDGRRNVLHTTDTVGRRGLSDVHTPNCTFAVFLRDVLLWNATLVLSAFRTEFGALYALGRA